jgi:enediyne biosynthesis protein E4
MNSQGTLKIGLLPYLVTLATVAWLGCGMQSREERPEPPALTMLPEPSGSVLEEPLTDDGSAWLAEVSSADTGVDFRHVSGNSDEKPFPAANGSGVAALDYDGDGLYDLYFATGAHFPLRLDGTGPSNRCYRNLGDWKFADVTEATRLGLAGFSAGLAVGDYDNDGFPDIYVVCYGANRLYRNQGDGTFLAMEDAGVADPRWGASAAFFDYDNDGLLDLYVCNYAQWTFENNQFCGDPVRMIRRFCGPSSIPGEQDALFRNRGDGTFENATVSSGMDHAPRRSQGVVAAHLNDDPYIDLYVGNDLNANSLFFNRGDGTFVDATERSGAAYDALGHMQAGMGVDAGDVNGNGHFDLIVTNFQDEYNTLYENLGDGFFQDVTKRRGIAAESRPWVGWGTVFADLNFNGWPDLIVTNGHVDDNLHLLGDNSPYAAPPLLWTNERGRFRFVGDSAGAYFRRSHVGRGLTLVDLDGDGDQDLVITHQDDYPGLLRNQAIPRDGGPEKAIVLRLVGRVSNRDAVGTRIRFRAGPREVVSQIKGGGSYLSAHDLRQVFAVLPGETDFAADITWPDGHVTILTDLRPGDRLTVPEPW